MSKYSKGPYHYVEFCDESSAYHSHVCDLVDRVSELSRGLDVANYRVHEVGCGEGLILSQLAHNGFTTTGNDADPEAVRMGVWLCNDVRLESDIAKSTATYLFDAVIFSDSLEHIRNWEEHLRWAMERTTFVVIAVPDRHDKHGLRDFKIDSFDALFVGWEKVCSVTRSARHLLVFKR